MLRRSANKARKGGSMLIRFLESTFFLKICKRARAVRENAEGRVAVCHSNILRSQKKI